ncbi:unnamed protein product [Sphagnum tenellum]
MTTGHTESQVYPWVTRLETLLAALWRLWLNFTNSFEMAALDPHSFNQASLFETTSFALVDVPVSGASLSGEDIRSLHELGVPASLKSIPQIEGWLKTKAGKKWIDQAGSDEDTRHYMAFQNEIINEGIKGGRTPLCYAVMTGRAEMAKFLVENKANVNAPDSYSWTPLHYAAAAKKSSVEMVKFLIYNKAGVNATDSDGKSPLLVAAKKGNIEVAKIFIENKAKLNAKDSSGFTPLNTAIVYGQTEMAKFLINSRADINAKTKNGDSPLDLAIERGFKKIETFLRSRPDIKPGDLKKQAKFKANAKAAAKMEAQGIDPPCAL